MKAWEESEQHNDWMLNWNDVVIKKLLEVSGDLIQGRFGRIWRIDMDNVPQFSCILCKKKRIRLFKPEKECRGFPY